MFNTFCGCCESQTKNEEIIRAKPQPRVGLTDEGTQNNRASVPASSQPQFPKKEVREEPPMVTVRPVDASPANQSLNLTQEVGNRSDYATLSVEEKQREKERLQKLVKQFAKEAVAGIDLYLIDPSVGVPKRHVWTMDRQLTGFFIRPSEQEQFGDATMLTDLSATMKQVANITKGQQMLNKFPVVSQDLGPFVVAMELVDPPRNLYFYFPQEDREEKDKFYTCLRILSYAMESRK